MHTETPVKTGVLFFIQSSVYGRHISCPVLNHHIHHKISTLPLAECCFLYSANFSKADICNFHRYK